MKRSTVSLCVIAKDEIRNVERFFDSFAPAVDEIHFTDTGSTDGTIEFVTKLHHSNKYNIPIYLHHFKWVDDFAAARNFSFEQATCDYVLWADLDDCLNSAEKFIGWRDNVMHLADYWLATYNYALDKNGKSVCAFARERVVKRSLGFKWRYFVHEGILAVAKDGSKPGMQYATTWSIDHMRSDEDLKADRSRNLNLFAGREAELDPRMEYYYGKELFENKQPEPALKWLLKSITNKDLELHDRILGMQYAVMAATQVEKFDQALQLAHQGMLLAPTRAEFYVLAGDILVKQRNLAGSIPFYHAATFCDRPVEGGTAGAIYTSPESSSVYPLNQLARVYFHTGSLDRARAIATDAFQRYGNAETRAVLDELEKLSGPSSGSSVQSLCPVEDILISCHPNGFYEWDEKIAQERGIGGSETAVVHMARHLHNLTGRKVFIFNNRDKELVIDGVHYKPFNQLGEYVKNFLPAIHIAWRHNNYLTPAPTYIWCHDLGFHGIEKDTGYSKILALSDFHSSFLQNMFAIKPERIHITRNGLDPKRFEGLSTDQKQHGKVVFSSSADRGLKRAILVMDEVVKKIPDATLHVYYGFDNMTRNGLVDQVKELQGMMCDRPYIHYHGNIQQDLLAKELSKAEVWLYPANFLETHCISALEALACKVYPVVRDWGALPFTLGASYNEGAKGDIVDLDCVTPEEVSVYAELTCNAICEKKWQSISVDLKNISWESVAREWISSLPISPNTKVPSTEQSVPSE